MNGVPHFAMMPWFPRDFASSTLLWPLIARGAYRELLDLQWNLSSVTQGGVLPDEQEKLRTAIRATSAEWKVAWPHVAPKFPKITGGRQNSRLEHHRQEAVKKYLARRKGALLTNTKRWGASLSDSLSDSHSDRLSESPPSPSPSPSRKSKRLATGKASLQGDEVGSYVGAEQ